MKRACILLTAIVPTEGHKALIEFGMRLVRPENLTVIFSGRSFEPTMTKDRIKALIESLASYGWCTPLVVQHLDDNAPQSPITPTEWDYWRGVCINAHPCKLPYDYLIASEPYGKKMAKVLGCEFIPYDMARDINQTKGTLVRKDLLQRFSEVIQPFRHHLKIRATIFGQESTGKTTITNTLKKSYGFDGIHEFARPYLESLTDKTITKQKMDTIFEGQSALQNHIFYNGTKPLIVQDTDLLSTVGYCRIYGCKPHKDFLKLLDGTLSDIYFVMSDDTPFEEDILRYGGSKRESTKQFWIDILNEFGCKYHIVNSTRRVNQFNEVRGIILDEFYKKNDKTINFRRGE